MGLGVYYTPMSSMSRHFWSHGWESALIVLARIIKRFNRDSTTINPVVLSSPYQPTLYGSKTENLTGLFWILTYSFPLSAEIAASASDSLARVTKANPLLRPERSSLISLYIQFQHLAYKGLVKVNILILQFHPIQKRLVLEFPPWFERKGSFLLKLWAGDQ